MEPFDQSAEKWQTYKNKSKGYKKFYKGNSYKHNQSSTRLHRGCNYDNRNNDNYNTRKPENAQYYKDCNDDLTPTRCYEDTEWDVAYDSPRYSSRNLDAIQRNQHNCNKDGQQRRRHLDVKEIKYDNRHKHRNKSANKGGIYYNKSDKHNYYHNKPSNASNNEADISLVALNETSNNINRGLHRLCKDDANNLKKTNKSSNCDTKKLHKNHDTSRLQSLLLSNNSSEIIKATNSKSNSVDTNKSRVQFEDISFEKFEWKLNRYEMNDFKRVSEVYGDLFTAGKEYALAHCVAEDMIMGSGIAVQFRRDFGRVNELLQQRQGPGGVAYIVHEDRYIFYLVTKRESTKKPTLGTLFQSVHALQKLMVENNVKKLAIPRIGCGLDRLEWFKVKRAIEYIFTGTDIDILVWNHQQEWGLTEDHRKRKCVVKTESYPITAIDEYTIILYLGSEDRFVTNEMKALDNKFHSIISDYRNSRRLVGEYILSKTSQDKYHLYGCIVKKRTNDLFDFKHFEKCITEINRINRLRRTGYMYEYVGMQYVIDINDDLLSSKICNMLSNIFCGVQIHICMGQLDL